MQELQVTVKNGSIAVTRDDGIVVNSACGSNTDAFSATELLAASLASCVAASIAPILSRHGVDGNSLRLTLRPLGETAAQGFELGIMLQSRDDELRRRCERAANACPVRRALNVPVNINWQDDRE